MWNQRSRKYFWSPVIIWLWPSTCLSEPLQKSLAPTRTKAASAEIDKSRSQLSYGNNHNMLLWATDDFVVFWYNTSNGKFLLFSVIIRNKNSYVCMYTFCVKIKYCQSPSRNVIKFSLEASWNWHKHNIVITWSDKACWNKLGVHQVMCLRMCLRGRNEVRSRDVHQLLFTVPHAEALTDSLCGWCYLVSASSACFSLLRKIIKPIMNSVLSLHEFKHIFSMLYLRAFLWIWKLNI